MFGTLYFSGKFEGQPYGWSETYPFLNTDYASTATALKNIYTQRNLMLATDITEVGSRVSDGDIRGDSYPTGIPPNQPGAYPTGTISTSPPHIALRQLYSSQNLYRGTRWIHAIPYDNYNPPGAFIATTPWNTAFIAWQNLVKANCGIAKRIATFPATPAWTFHAIDTAGPLVQASRNIGRPFGQSVGRRMT
jgi:hypothetical protein